MLYAPRAHFILLLATLLCLAVQVMAIDHPLTPSLHASASFVKRSNSGRQQGASKDGGQPSWAQMVQQSTQKAVDEQETKEEEERKDEISQRRVSLPPRLKRGGQAPELAGWHQGHWRSSTGQ